MNLKTFLGSRLLLIVLLFSGQTFAAYYNIVDFGAISDGKFVNTKAINDAVIKCKWRGNRFYIANKMVGFINKLHNYNKLIH